MKNLWVVPLIICVFLIPSTAFSEDELVEDYVVSPHGQVYKNSYGECWRSSFKETAEKLEECGYEKEVVATPTVMTTMVTEEVEIRAGLLFDFDSADLSDDAKAVLDERIEKYKGRTELTSNVKVIGHTDSIGTEEYNQQLSEKRAKSVAEYLEQNSNIVDDQIDVIGKGEIEPKASNHTPEGRAANRRVIIILQGKVTQ